MQQEAPGRPRFCARGLAVAGIGPVDFELAPGQCLSLSGPSGAGKTRLLRAMADLEAHHGECALDGRVAADFSAPDWRSRVVFLAAESAWWEDTVAAHLPAIDDRLSAYRGALDLDTAVLAQPPGRLSSGQRQRAALLRLLARAPEVLLLDEPTANLDPENIDRVERLIADYCRKQAACSVWVGHDAAQRARVAQRHIVLDRAGQVAACT